MAKQTDQQIGRRLGRMEMLSQDLQQLPDNYQPVEREVEKAAALVAQIGQVYGSSQKTEQNYGAVVEISQALGLEENAEFAEAKEAVLALVRGKGIAQKRIEELVIQVASLETDLAQTRKDLEAAGAKPKKNAG